ncbi:unnamed protein product [Adineta steineri]|uniref:G/T mismatch-specific thymine DNA glycosylase n=1 Tax=Adineta steineri TaxID=433720 RepID=A0A819NPG5_9BILA|nr:unnamed protein product [Adineta steineri]CAF4001493.1 unnamed protein product [Adineta steineri]
MNDELTTQASQAPIVLKLKKYDDIILPHSSRLSTDTLNDNSSSSFIPLNETPIITTVSPSSLRVKLKKPLFNGDDDEYINANSLEVTSRPAKRSKKSSANDNIYNNISELNNDLISTQQNMNEIKQEHCIINEQPSNSPLVLKIRRDSLASTIGNSTTVETETNRQLLLKLKKNEYGELTTRTIPNDNSSNVLHNNNNNNNNEYTNGHNDSLNISLQQGTKSSNQPHITNMLSNLSDDNQWNDHQINSNHTPQQTTTTSHISMDVTPTPSALSTAAETHTKELLDEALDSVKSVLMQTFRKNLEAGGDLNALKSTLGSDEVAEVFLSKLRESLKRETISTTENEQKTPEHINTNIEIRPSQPTTPSSSLNTIISPIMNVVSPSPSSSPLPSISTIISKTNSSPSTPIPTSPQPITVTTTTTKRKNSNPVSNPNRFDGTTEEELTKRLLSDILQPNLDIVFVGINPSLYAVHKGHHYGGPGNHFWKLLHMSDLIPNAFTADDDYRMPHYGIGFTNIVQRPSKAGSDITKDEITAGAEILMQKIKMYRPKIVAFNGRGIYEVYANNKHFHYGKQPDLFLETDTHVFVMPSSSARCSQLPRAEDKLPFYVGLRKLRDFVNGTLHTLNEAEITFPDIKIKDTDDVLQKTIIRISNKPFSELSPETLKSYGDKIPQSQMTSKYKTDMITTQTMSILHNQQNGNLLNYDQQGSLHNGIISSKTSLTENSAIAMNDTDAAVLAALANGVYSSSSPSRQSQTIYIGRQQQQQSISYSGSSLKNNSTNLNCRSSTPPPSSHTIHHLPYSSLNDHSLQSSPSSILSSNSQIVSHQIVLMNPNERISSSSSSINSIVNSTSLKDLLSSQQPTQKQQFAIPTIPSIVQTSNMNLPKTSYTTNKILNNSTDDGLYLRYEREQPSNQNSFHFSYIIDEYSSSIPKRSRYVSINDL